MHQLPKEIKLDLFTALIGEKDVFGKLLTGNNILDFLSKIWNLETMDSEDNRFKNAREDIWQHTINNQDWNYRELFIDRLKLIEDDEKFDSFIETILSPECRKDADEIMRFVLITNSYIEKFEYALAIDNYNEENIPVYKIKIKDDLPLDIKENKIPFFVIKNLSGRSDNPSSHSKPTQFPSFVLAFNSGWNDYGRKTSFSLFYYNEGKDVNYIGDLKIIREDELPISDVIPEEFVTLNKEYCSLGLEISFYKKLKEIFNQDFESILFALKDSAFFIEIQEKFERINSFNSSLLRTDTQERVLREARYIIYDYDRSNLYSFKYIFKPKFSEDSTDIIFSFSDNHKLKIANRIYAIIGKNGTGKTQLITSLPLDISKKDDQRFVPKAPLFSKVIAVSYSIFDKFEIPKKTSSFNYSYCGLRNGKGEEFSERGLVLRFHNTWKEIEKKGRILQWKAILLNFIEKEIISEFIIKKEDNRKQEYTVNIDGFNRIKNKLSSGQNIILFILSEIVANIRFDSLLLFDEPETHLHPNAISQLMNSIYELVEEFQSYCIIATHSPLIIRELISKNVYVIDRSENLLSVNRIGIECFGENLSTLTEEVFGNKDVHKQYKKIIGDLVKKGDSFDDIVSYFKFDELPLSLNVRLYLQSIIKERDEKPKSN
ncbi:MAG TPA: AAA family ATPase [Bacteroidia bacterium]|nr:AAA family ATPase [Bacteroidia bacterium]